MMDSLIEELVAMADDLEKETAAVVTVGQSDLIHLPEQSIDAIVSNLRKRYNAGYSHTRCGPRTVLALPTNSSTPCCQSTAPHVRQLCSWIHLRAYDGDRDQSILFHRTPSDFYPIAVAHFDQHIADTTLPLRLEQIHCVSSLFANVSTHTESHVSRMGVSVDVSVDFKGDVCRVICNYFAFDRGCVSSVFDDSDQSFRTSFHVFYALLHGASLTLLKSLKLHRNVNSYNLLRLPSECTAFVLDSNWAKEHIAKLEDILSKVCNEEDVNCVWQVLSAILHLANLQFTVNVEVDGSTTNKLLNQNELDDACSLLGIDAQILKSCILSMNNSSNLNLPTSNAESRLNCVERVGLLCQVLYSRLVHVLFANINEKMSSCCTVRTRAISLISPPSVATTQNSGNSLHQFLTNYSIERLHSSFIDNQCNDQQSLYLSEGLSWTMVRVGGVSGAVVEHLEAAVSLLDQCQDTAVRLAFRKRMQQAANMNHSSHTPCVFDSDKDRFIVQHFWDKVTYNPSSFVQQNMEKISSEITGALSRSKLRFVQTLFPEGRRPSFNRNKTSASSGNKKRLSVAMQCQFSLLSIVNGVRGREVSNFISINPNDMNLCGVFDENVVRRQIESYRIHELSRICEMGYCESETYVECLKRYRMVCSSTWPTWNSPAKQGILNICNALLMPHTNYALGRTRIFWKAQTTVIELERKRNFELERLARLIQKNMRQWVAMGGKHSRLLTSTNHKAQTLIASHYRAYKQRKNYMRMKDAAIVISSHVRGWQVRRRYRCLFRSIAADKICQFLQNCLRRRYLVDLGCCLPNLSPIDCDWPNVSPYLCRDVDAYLKTLYHRWRCRIYRQRIDQQGYFRMREKLAASIIFLDKKVGYDATVAHPFRGDYVRLRQNPKWRRISIDTSDEYVVFADMISKINRTSGKVSAVLLVVSTSGALILDHRTLTIRHRVAITDIQRVSLSPYGDSICVLHLTPGRYLSRKSGDLVLECRHVVELVSKLYLVVQNATANALPVEISPSLFVEGEEGTIEVVFCAPNADVDDLAEQTTSCFSASPSSLLRHSTSQPEKLVKKVFSPISAPLSPSSTPTELTPSKRTKFIKKGNVLQVHF